VKLCKECRFMVPGAIFPVCDHPSALRPASVDPVTGEPVMEGRMSCWMARSAEIGNWCGPDGRHWRAKLAAETHPC
jgi:hypothetical protein